MSKKPNKAEMVKMAAKLASDPEIARRVAESRAAFELGRTLQSDKALPAVQVKTRVRA